MRISRPLRILHISDLHERAEFAGMPESRPDRLRLDREQRGYVLGSKFVEALRELAASPIDIVCFTGDLTDWGKVEEYEAASTRIAEILHVVDVPRARFFAVPGNHDVDRSVQPAAWKQLRACSTANGNRNALGKWFRGVGEPPFGVAATARERVLERTRPFWEWYRRFREDTSDIRGSHLLGYRVPVHLDHWGVPPIQLIGLDSAWLCGANGEQGQLLVTEEQVLAHIRDGFNAVEGYRIALIHHPLDHLADGHAVRRLLSNDGVDLVLHGHQHQPTALSIAEAGLTIQILAAGCLMEGDLGVTWPNGFNLLEVDPSARSGRVHFRKWSRDTHFWAIGSDLYNSAPRGTLAWPATSSPDSPIPLKAERAPPSDLRAPYPPSLHGTPIGGRVFPIDVLDWSDGGRRSYRPEHLEVRLDATIPNAPDWVLSYGLERIPLPANATNGTALCGLMSIVPALVGDDEEQAVRLSCYRHDYLHHVRTVHAVGTNPELRALVTSHAAGVLLPHFAAGIGVVLWVRTSDNKLVMSVRSGNVAVRKGERDASVVEGLHTTRDRAADCADRVSVHTTCVEGCREELNIVVAPSDVDILAIGCDLDYYQCNFYGLVNAPMTYAEIVDARRRSGRAHRLEAREIQALSADPVQAFAELAEGEANGAPMWATAWAALYFALVRLSETGRDDARRTARTEPMSVESAARLAFQHVDAHRAVP